MIAALFGEDRALRLSDYPRILTELHERNPDEYNLRTLEKAYYQQYRATHNIGRW